MTIVVAALFGLAFGSFANAAIDRIRARRSLFGRSACDGCGRHLAAWELMPVVSYLLLRGRCGGCEAAIGMRTPFLELACGLAFACSFALLPTASALAASAAFIAAIVLAGIIERRRAAA